MHRAGSNRHTRFSNKTGDVARIEVPRGKYTDDYLTRIISVRKTGSFSIKPTTGYSKPVVTNHKYCQPTAPTATICI